MNRETPSKAELKKKYGINNEDFQVLIGKLPSEVELQKEGKTLERVADWLGIPAYVVRVGSMVTAIFLIPATAITLWDDAAKSYHTYCEIMKPFGTLPSPTEDAASPHFKFAGTTSNTVAVSFQVTLTDGTADV